MSRGRDVNASRGTVVVTGASRGIGEACALRLDALGFRVYATKLPAEDGLPLQRKASERLRVVELELTDPTSIAAAAQTVGAAVRETGLTGLVNNAGVHAAVGPLEFLPLNALREQLEVNVTGQIAVTQAFLPLLRAGHGRIVMMGSVAGEIAYPFLGPYSASKAALRALAAALRVELQPWGIPVALVLPGAIATTIWERSVHELDDIASALTPIAQARYGPALAAVRRFREQTGKHGSPVEVVAGAVEHALTARRPKTRYLAGRHARLMTLLGHLPHPTFDRFIAGAMGLPGHNF